jgi:hypothetical protein
VQAYVVAKVKDAQVNRFAFWNLYIDFLFFIWALANCTKINSGSGFSLQAALHFAFRCNPAARFAKTTLFDF